ncbi:hypothetical protein L1887_58197 [Cichorium endivia]|nr:hypothetical protein L1887_58197 [Cichorium endivia]
MISRPTTPILHQPGSSSLATPRSSAEQHRSGRQGITIEEPVRPRGASHSSLASAAGSGSNSPSRSGIVGDGTYGGRRGGPSMHKSRTSSSGGLSDVKAGYERRVGFDTMPDADETNSGAFSFTLQVKSRGFLRTKNTRTFMVAVDDNAHSERALEWLMENLVEDGDEVVAVRILDGEADQIDQEEAREEARELMASIVELNEEAEDRKISIVVEFVAGKVVSTILRIIHVYRPDSLTVGTRGKSANKFQKMLGQHIMGPRQPRHSHLEPRAGGGGEARGQGAEAPQETPQRSQTPRLPQPGQGCRRPPNEHHQEQAPLAPGALLRAAPRSD